MCDCAGGFSGDSCEGKYTVCHVNLHYLDRMKRFSQISDGKIISSSMKTVKCTHGVPSRF